MDSSNITKESKNMYHRPRSCRKPVLNPFTRPRILKEHWKKWHNHFTNSNMIPQMPYYQLMEENHYYKWVSCKELSWSDGCQTISALQARKHEVKGKCCVCLAPGHLKLKCKVEKQCFHCKGKTVAIEVYVQIFSN